MGVTTGETMHHILKQLNRQQLEQIVEDLSDEIRFLENQSQNLQELLDIVAENERKLRQQLDELQGVIR
jgi:predicted nuclease with TOPRIM domain